MPEDFSYIEIFSLSDYFKPSLAFTNGVTSTAPSPLYATDGIERSKMNVKPFSLPTAEIAVRIFSEIGARSASCCFWRSWLAICWKFSILRWFSCNSCIRRSLIDAGVVASFSSAWYSVNFLLNSSCKRVNYASYFFDTSARVCSAVVLSGINAKIS